MGSFASTCCVSGLPIEYGDKVRFFLLTENPYSNEGVCEMHGLWLPRTFPLRAQYDDYGGVEKVETGPGRDLWLEGFRLDLAGRKRISFNALLQGLSEDKIRVRQLTHTENDHKNDKPDMRVLGAMIREDVWRELLNERIQNWNGRSWGIDKYRERVVKVHEQLVKKIVYWDDDYGIEINQALKNRDADRIVSANICRDSMIDYEVRKACRKNGFIEWMYLDKYSWIMGPGRHMRLITANISVPKTFFSTAVEFSFIRAILMNCRYYWRPSYSCGPQFGEWKAHKKFNNAIARVAGANASRIARERELEEKRFSIPTASSL